MKEDITRRTLVAMGSAALLSSPTFGKIDWDGEPRVMQGPMVGYVTADKVSIWLRLNGEYRAYIEYSMDQNFNVVKRSDVKKASKQNDLILTFVLNDLRPGSDVFYRIIVSNEVPRHLRSSTPLQTKTAPIQPVPFRVAFGSCARYAQHPVQPVWDAVYRDKPDLFLWLGDNIYGDTLDPILLREEYKRQRGVPNFKPLMQSTPQLAIWDDHDYGLNDHDKRHPGKQDALTVFKEYWANPSYGLPGTEGVFFKYSYGGTDFFFLDNRYYKDPANFDDNAGKSLLGLTQLDWLKSSLLESTAPFKILVSGIGWTSAKGPKQEAWSSYLTERDSLFDFIKTQGVSGVVLLSGDTHIAELNSIPWSEKGGYDFYEFVSSPLAQECSTSWLNYRAIPRIRQVYAGGSNYGLLSIDCSQSDPSLSFVAKTINGAPVWNEFSVKASELVNGKSTYFEKMDQKSKIRWKRFSTGKGYYG